MFAEGEGVKGGNEWEARISRCQLLHVKWINKILLDSTGNCIQCPVINHNRKEYEKGCICLCITESLCSTAVINTTL